MCAIIIWLKVILHCFADFFLLPTFNERVNLLISIAYSHANDARIMSVMYGPFLNAKNNS